MHVVDQISGESVLHGANPLYRRLGGLRVRGSWPSRYSLRRNAGI
ncbi:hypothetical protein MYA_3976 [Burkholderia sp. KJ006]|nr:hypothetical protein MYA_3976 [Burkholderia sp. KJ006]